MPALYLCDPRKNKVCTKTECHLNGGDCIHTTHIEYALEETSNMKIKLIDFGYKEPPRRAHENDAGADVFVQRPVSLRPHETTKVPLGFGLELPDGYMACVFPRSGLSSKGIVCELPPIDSGYRGEVHAIVSNLTDAPYQLCPGDRVGQLVVMPVVLADFITHDIKERGTGAFASTGL